ncbi:MAG TPA: hypothetical protein VLN56_08635 [Gammaproteobacteria bacterium]|nr:hypothetical protein [Gammaproteobacteria bacterium]
MARRKIDKISGPALFFCSVAVYAGLVMVARLLGNLFIAGNASNSDLLIGLLGASVIYFAFKTPKKRIENSVAAYPEQEKSIVNRFLSITVFLFLLVLGLNMWAWNTDHGGTYTYQGPSRYIKDEKARKKYSEEIKRHTRKSTSDDIVILRIIITTLTFGASIMYFVLLIQPYEKK